MSKIRIRDPQTQAASKTPLRPSTERLDHGQRESHFSSDHLYLCAFLLCRDHQLIGTSVGEGNRIFFAFEDSGPLRVSVSEFMCGGEIAARQYSLALLQLKKLISSSPTFRRNSNAMVQTSFKQQK
jgi:hypothetical protein